MFHRGLDAKPPRCRQIQRARTEPPRGGPQRPVEDSDGARAEGGGRLAVAAEKPVKYPGANTPLPFTSRREVLPLLFVFHRTDTAPSSQWKKAPTPRPAPVPLWSFRQSPRPDSNRLASRLRNERSSQRASRAKAGGERIELSEQGFGDLAVPSTPPICFTAFRCELRRLRAKKKRPGNLLGHPASQEEDARILLGVG
jgi:hypothetical protein